MYDNLIEECVHGQEGRIDRNLKRVQEYLEANFKDIAIAIKDIVIGFLRNKAMPFVIGFIFKNRGAAPEVPKQEVAKEVPLKEADEVSVLDTSVVSSSDIAN